MSSLVTSVLLVVLSQVLPGCSLFRLNTVKGASDGGGGVVTRLEIVVPAIEVNLGWSGGSWLTKNETFVCGILVCAVLVVLGFLASRLRRG